MSGTRTRTACSRDRRAPVDSTTHPATSVAAGAADQTVPAPNFDVIASLAKRRGFVFPSSEIYGGMAGFWDWGPLGVELKNNIKAASPQKT